MGEVVDEAKQTGNADLTLEAFKKLVPHLRGALWWAKNEVIKKRLLQFNQKDEHLGHPILSIRKEEVSARAAAVPMLVGTSGHSFNNHQRGCCIDVVGMTKIEPERHTYFGSIVEPMLVRVSELLAGVKPAKRECTFVEKDRDGVGRHDEKAWQKRAGSFEYRYLRPNWDKPMVSESEMAMVDDYCIFHRL